ncbi:amidase [Pseudomonas brassicacearum]|uniref:amidase n=1 Tax=Pseudomonas brassicacearum TaxID=930166 RepID=UPI000F4A6300|nr:amidase family protein [Pseudomonas brassicacearum]ROM69817.1 amidase [Pseudomonas brassicacearum]
MKQSNELVEKTAVELRELIGTQAISPVELMQACIERIEAVNPYVNAVTATDFERSLEQARVAERAVLAGEPLGLLHGLPVGIKDLENTEGLLTTYGSPLFKNNVPAQDNALVARLRSAGGIVTAKTNVPEMGAGANTRNAVWGATGNPFNPRLNAGGSSGGSAAALATDMLPVCSGSDTGGSLRIPAAKCGVVGLRPSPGLVPSERRLLGWTPISVVGPMGRTVADTCLQLQATAGLHISDPLSYPIAANTFARLPEIDLGTLRVGYTEDFGCCEVDNEIREVFRRKIKALSGQFKCCEPVQFQLGDAHRCFDVLRAESFVAGLRDAYRENPDSLGPNPRANYELGVRMSLEDCAWGAAEQTRIYRQFQSVFDQYDLILSPTTPVSPFPWIEPHLAAVNGVALDNYYRWLSLTYVVTLATNPAISLPCGLDHRNMPFGLQIIAPFRRDLELLACASQIEKATLNDPQLQRPRPDLIELVSLAVDLKSIVTAPPSGSADGIQVLTGTSSV